MIEETRTKSSSGAGTRQALVMSRGQTIGDGASSSSSTCNLVADGTFYVQKLPVPQDLFCEWVLTVPRVEGQIRLVAHGSGTAFAGYAIEGPLQPLSLRPPNSIPESP